MQKLLQSLLFGTALALTVTTVQAADRNRDIGVNVGGIDLGVDIDLGGKKGLDADVDVGLGGKKGLDADVDATIGSKNGVDADVDVTLGGKKGLDADADLSLGGDDGIDAGVTAGIGDDVNVDVGLGVDDTVATDPDPGVEPGKDPGGSTLTAVQRRAFDRMSARERSAMLKRCGTVDAGGYDPALVKLCTLLRLSASR